MDRLLEEKIADYLVRKGLLIATAESCTGGLIGHRITNINGSSRYYLGSIIAYAYEVKRNSLAVKMETLEAHGAVSEESVAEMAVGVCKKLNADIGLSVSGIAGPSGGTEEKSVGLVCFGLKTPDGLWTSKQHFSGNRLTVKDKAADFGLDFLLRYLTGELEK